MTDWFDPRTLFGDQSLSIGDMLPLQSNAAVSTLSPSKNDDDSKGNLPIVPQGNLKDILMGKFDDPEIPSGVPTDEQQQQAFTHRLIGNATGDVVANLQNTANILKPGAGNPSMGDSSRRFGEILAQRALGNAQERRQEALQNFQLKDATDQRHERMYQQAVALKQAQDERDPNSPTSRQAQHNEIQRLDMLGASASPEVQAQIAQRKAMLPSLSASAIATASRTDPLQKLVELRSAETQAGAKLAGENANRQSEAQHRLADESLGNRRLAAEERHWEQEGKDKENNKSKLQLNEDKKAEEDIANLRNAKAELDRHIQNLKSGKIDNNKVSVYGNEAAKLGSSLGIPIKPDSALQDMLTSIPLAQATAEKAVTGSSRYTPARWTQFAVQPGEGTQNSINKLSGGSRYLDELIKERMTQLHTNATGAPTSQSAMAKEFPPGALQQNAAQVQARTQTGATGAPGAIKLIKGGGKAQQQPDGSWKRIE